MFTGSFAIFLESLVLAIPALFALLNTSPINPKNTYLKVFKNRYAALGFGILIVIMAFVLASMIIYNLGGCEGGLKDNAICSNIPNEYGTISQGVLFLGWLYLLFIGLPAFCCYVVAELITRIRIYRVGN